MSLGGRGSSLDAPTQTAKVMIDAASRLNKEFPLIKLPVGTELGERSLVPGDDAQLGENRFEDWLSRPAGQN